MTTFDLPELLVVVAASAVTSLFAFAILRAIPFRGLAQRDSQEDQARFLIRDMKVSDANRSGARLLQTLGIREGTYADLVQGLSERFPKLPEEPGKVVTNRAKLVVPPDNPEDSGVLTLESVKGGFRMALSQRRGCVVEEHVKLSAQSKAARLQAVTDATPAPAWICDGRGDVIWSNAAYREAVDTYCSKRDPGAELLDLAPLDPSAHRTSTRASLCDVRTGHTAWFDVVSVPYGNGALHVASDVTALVKAERAQRDFVQTLAKTFAQLSIGLAIFDRDRQLMLFNPALVDLTSTSVEFLTRKPNLLTFFDQLREHRVMPEPKDYASWREQIAEVVMAARDGSYAETWNLPSGLTYRVTGRPHPDGALAFLFEDISAEISLTRRFREELELGHEILDAMDCAVAAFTATGSLAFANDHYTRLWDAEDDSAFRDISSSDAVETWRTQCKPSADFDRIRDLLLETGARRQQVFRLVRQDGTELTCRVVPLTGGATLVRFASTKDVGVSTRASSGLPQPV